MYKKLVSLLILLSLLICSFLTSCGETEVNVPNGMKLASGEAASYYFFVPDSWEIDLQTAATSARVSNSDRSNVSVTAWELQYTDSKISEWWETNLAEMKNAFTDFELVSEDSTLLDGEACTKYVFTAKLGENEYKYMQAAAIHDYSIYVITYTADPDVFDSHSEEVTTILTTFRFK